MTLQIELSGVNKYYGAFHALKNINLSIKKGTFVALVGPSGCGKSTLLRSLAGLETISAGDMRIAGTLMNGVPPRKRDVAMVFQSYALYPHMTVEENLTYSLRMRGVAKAEARKAAEEVAATTGLSKLMKRYPRELSGGQRQRVAMSRAIIRNPQAFLFDEPLSNLDAALRVHMRKEIRALHDRLHATSVYVTHDQIEAMTMADHVVVMRDGVIEQQGTPLELYDRPVNRFVAGFIGSPAMNFIPATVSPDGASLLLRFGEGDPQQPIRAPAALPPGKHVIVGIRPEHIRPVAAEGAALTLPVSAVETTGSATFLTLGGSTELVIAVQGRSAVKAGEAIGLDINPADMHLFDEATGIGLARQ
ncbi:MULTISPECIES: ABC transporter ATP-binding protein [Agrobacterium tumefaciens complex]|jgi:multiple sugar transport system ATP-binding protein|uniref:ABC transporter ATP-binding protein n=2 Tax=Agrobacterium tumefaciens TaxID=358 RepID=A0AAP9E9K8_AGRTU|nr:ABC transporter ATP-binding protein [Agrobacterium tumefaciens]AYM84343.1 multiple sugar transport system ATP-binding protein [Agrobacterium tumefaciens]EHH07054.1 sugar ABC transporter, nucleotide binding/ATPase protein [Agrobacterium tumefaciens CCNWGS0286]NSZ60603.1 ABC transporter ATP-binding protein [Agrobacterium tumefaciens]NTE67358.1 ABC transporter ATP-binding protein [Agrobacterium tumefaciens]NTE94561.1 ABC transporter ATP-binding protein [Agrobacterium tumefaciens]